MKEGQNDIFYITGRGCRRTRRAVSLLIRGRPQKCWRPERSFCHVRSRFQLSQAVGLGLGGCSEFPAVAVLLFFSCFAACSAEQRSFFFRCYLVATTGGQYHSHHCGSCRYWFWLCDSCCYRLRLSPVASVLSVGVADTLPSARTTSCQDPKNEAFQEGFANKNKNGQSILAGAFLQSRASC